MGIIRQGANGGFSGKAGSVIGSSWKSIDYIKGLYRKRTKPASPEQLEQQARFAAVMRFLLPITPFIKVGFGQKMADRATPVNVAFRENIRTALIGQYPDFELDYAKVLISTGSYVGGGTVGAEVDNGVLSVSWNPELNKIYSSRDDDQVYILLYQPAIEEFLTAPTPPTRADGGVDIALPEHFLGGEGHVWIFFTDRHNRKVSKSSYLGQLNLS